MSLFLDHPKDQSVARVWLVSRLKSTLVLVLSVYFTEVCGTFVLVFERSFIVLCTFSVFAGGPPLFLSLLAWYLSCVSGFYFVLMFCALCWCVRLSQGVLRRDGFWARQRTCNRPRTWGL